VKHLRRALLILALLLVAAIAGFALWLRSESALDWALAQAQRHTGGALHIGSSEGSLNRPILLKDVEWDSGSLAVHVDSLRLQWRPLAGLIGRVQLNSVVAEHVTLQVRASGANDKPLQPPVMPTLPVRIVLEDVRVHGAEVSIAGLPPVQLDTLHFAARVDNDAIVVRELAASGPDINVVGSLTLAPHRDYAVDATLDWRYRSDSWAMLRGHTALKGDDRSLAIKQTLAAPYGADLQGTLKDAFTAPHWDGLLRLSRTDIAQIHAPWPDYRGDARLTLRGDPNGTAFKGEASVRGSPLGDVDARFDTTLKPHVAEIRSLSLGLAAGGQVSATGRLGFDAATQTALIGGWKDLAWPRTDPTLQSPSGTFRLDGDRDSWRADLDGAIAPQASVHAHLRLARSGREAWTLQADATDLKVQTLLRKDWRESLMPSGDWRLAAHGDDTQATVDSLTGDWLGGSLAVNGLYRRGSVDSWRAHAVMHGLSAGRLAEGWYGKVDGVLDADGSLGGGSAPRTELILETLHGMLRGSPLQAHGQADFAGAAWQQLSVDAKLGDDVLHADTDQHNRDVLHWQLDAPNLGQAWPDAAGSLHSHGSLETGAHLTLADIQLDAKKVAWHAWAADDLQLSAKAGSDGNGVAVLHGTGVALPGLNVSQVDAHAEGHIEKHALQLDISSDRGRLHLAGDAGYADRRWAARLTQVDLTPEGDGAWQAVAPWSLVLAPHLLDLQQACLAQGAAQACADITAGAETWRADGTLKALPLSALQMVLPAGLEYSGSVSADIKAGGDASGHRIAVDAVLSPGAVRDLRSGKPLTLLAYTGGEAHMRSDPKATVGHMSWVLNDGGSLQVDTRMNFGAQPALSGRIRGDIHDFALLPALLPQVTQASGRLALDIGLSGTPLDPLFSGTTTLSDGAVSIPRLGLNLTGLQVTIAGDGRHLDMAGSVRSGKGSLSLKGSADRNGGLWKATGQLQGQDFRSIDIIEAQVDLSPDLSFDLDGRDLKVDGTVTVPHAVLEPRDLSGTAQVSPDQVLVGEEGGPPEERWHLRSKIDVVLGTTCTSTASA